jgi:preprotein translocase subunit SecD
MNKNLSWKVIVTLCVLIFFLVGIFGIPDTFSGQGLVDSLKKQIHLGLDLKGGTHLILQVKVNDAVNADSDSALETIKQGMRDRKITYGGISKPDPVNSPDQIVIQNVSPNATSDLRSLISDALPEYDAAAASDNNWTITMKPQALKELKDRAVQQAIETIRNRIDTLGVSEPIVQAHGLGAYQILVELPAVNDPARVRAIIQSTAMLQVRQSFGGPYGSEQEALQQHGGVLPPDTVLLPGRSIGSASSGNGQVWYLISRVSAISGRDLRSADVSRDNDTGQPTVTFNLTSEGGQKFYNFTSQHVNDSLAVVLDNKVQEVANIEEPIRDNCQIRGNFTEDEAKDLALVLRSGALPAGINYLNESTVGPSLGADSIRHGVTAAIVGMVVVLIFMLVYYKGAGINADVALILNLVILLGAMGYIKGVLTLPGIAGVILTVGMGVDSNVLIFERIREELRNGKTPPSAVEQGFKHAWTAIFDTHVTTIVSAAILFVFGTGPVQGFATTLVLGLAANLFTAVFVSRIIFDWILSRKQRGEALSI